MAGLEKWFVVVKNADEENFVGVFEKIGKSE
jgi:hypothetical protein